MDFIMAGSFKLQLLFSFNYILLHYLINRLFLDSESVILVFATPLGLQLQKGDMNIFCWKHVVFALM